MNNSEIDDKKPKNENSRKNILKANCLETTRNLLEIYMIEKNLYKLTKIDVSNFFENWVKNRSKFELIRPYKLDQMVYQIMKIVLDFWALNNEYLCLFISECLHNLFLLYCNFTYF